MSRYHCSTGFLSVIRQSHIKTLAMAVDSSRVTEEKEKGNKQSSIPEAPLRRHSERTFVVKRYAEESNPNSSISAAYKHSTIRFAEPDESTPVPTMIRQTNANENPPSTGPPQMNRAITVRNVRPEVITVRLKVWFTARFMTASSGLSTRKLGVFADTIENHDGIVHGVADQRQQRGNYGHWDPLKKRKQPDGDQRVVEARECLCKHTSFLSVYRGGSPGRVRPPRTLFIEPPWSNSYELLPPAELPAHHRLQARGAYPHNYARTT
jgi:hypothetical protein